MKTQIGLFSVLLLVSWNAHGQDTYKVRSADANSCVWLRTDPTMNGTKIQCLEAGTQVTVLSSVPFWREVKLSNNKRGWIAKKYLVPAVSNALTPDPVTIPDNAILTVHFVDVGQGDAIWIQTHDDGIDGNGIFEGYTIVIDGGPYSTDKTNPLLPYMEDVGHHGADVEALIVTHPHDDHYSGAKSIVKHFNINHYYEPGYPAAKCTQTFLTFRAAAKAKAKNDHIGKENFGTLDWGKELKVEVLYSWAGDASNTLGDDNTEENNSSIVLRIQYGDHVFLLMGDAEGKERADSPTTPRFVEKMLLDTDRTKLKATVLKVGHHGSETSSTIPFIEAVDPEIVIVQSGRLKYGDVYLPDASTLKRYCDHNRDVMIYRTDEGDEIYPKAKDAVDKDNIIITTNGKGKPQVAAYKNGQPFAGTACGN